MVKNYVYALFDSVSEQVLQKFIASTDEQAKAMIVQFFKKNSELNSSDFSLYRVGDFLNPHTVEDIEDDNFVLISFPIVSSEVDNV